MRWIPRILLVLAATFAVTQVPPQEAASRLQGPSCGMGRMLATYRGHRIDHHGGDWFSIHSQIAYLPREHVGIVLFLRRPGL